MLVLALDTTTRGGSTAVARDGIVLCEDAGDASRPHAVRLPGELISTLERSGARVGDIDVFSVAVGPGSFTGLRVGIATMQGLAFATGKPLIGVSVLDALARRVTASGSEGDVRVAAWIDAWRGEVYAARYRRGVAVEPPVVARPEDLLAEYVEDCAAAYLVAGDGADAYRDVIMSRLGPRAMIADPPMPPLAGTIAQMATERHRAGEAPPPHAIRPLYIRRPDAELARHGRTR